MSSSGDLWKPLTWDTQFFEVNTARIMAAQLDQQSLPHVMAEISAWGGQVVHFLADAADDQTIQVAEQSGFHLVDIRVTFICDLRKITVAKHANDVTMRVHQDKDIPMLQHMARSSYQQTRFYYDSHYPREQCDALYETWITKSCHDNSQKVLVAEHHGELSGFVTYQHVAPDTTSTIGLVGVHEEKRGIGIGRVLLQAAQRDLIAHGVPTLEVVTQGRNIDAQRLYQRSGFVTKHVGLWYHKWI